MFDKREYKKRTGYGISWSEDTKTTTYLTKERT